MRGLYGHKLDNQGGVVSDTSAKSHTERILQEEQQTQKRFSAQSEVKAR